MLPYHPQLKEKARVLRKSMTDAELRLWRIVRKKQIGGLQFYRQKSLGPYIVDFYCPARRLVVEVDGGQHYETKGIRHDKIRDQFLVDQLGLKILRFTNLDVLKNLEGVIDKIMEVTNPPQSPFSKGGSSSPQSPFSSSKGGSASGGKGGSEGGSLPSGVLSLSKRESQRGIYQKGESERDLV